MVLTVMPANAGIQPKGNLGSRPRGNDKTALGH